MTGNWSEGEGKPLAVLSSGYLQAMNLVRSSEVSRNFCKDCQVIAVELPMNGWASTSFDAHGPRILVLLALVACCRPLTRISVSSWQLLVVYVLLSLGQVLSKVPLLALSRAPSATPLIRFWTFMQRSSITLPSACPTSWFSIEGEALLGAFKSLDHLLQLLLNSCCLVSFFQDHQTKTSLTALLMEH